MGAPVLYGRHPGCARKTPDGPADPVQAAQAALDAGGRVAISKRALRALALLACERLGTDPVRRPDRGLHGVRWYARTPGWTASRVEAGLSVPEIAGLFLDALDVGRTPPVSHDHLRALIEAASDARILDSKLDAVRYGMAWCAVAGLCSARQARSPLPGRDRRTAFPGGRIMAERDDLLRQVQAARTGDDLAAAVAALDAHDRHRTASLAQSRELDLSAADVRRTLDPLPAFERHTAATDWLGDEEIPSDYRVAMIVEASRWYRGIPRDLMTDPDEFNEQALGHAYTAASAYGDHALDARREFMTYLSYLTSTAASGLPQIQQMEDPKDDPAPTPLPTQVFDNFAPEQNEYNGVEGDNHDSQISSQIAPGIQALEQQNAGGSGFGTGPAKPVEHSTQMDTADSYAEVPLGPPGQIPAATAGPAPSAPSAPNPALGQEMDEGAGRRQTVSASYSPPDAEGFRWYVTAARDPEALEMPYHEKCGSLHWPEQACHNGSAHTASMAVGYLMNAEDFTRRAYFEHQGMAEAAAALGTGDRKRIVAHHNAIVAAFRAQARSEDEIAWLHGYMARVRPVLAGGGDAFGGKQAPPFGKKDKKDKKGKGKKKGQDAGQIGAEASGGRLDFPLAAEAALTAEAGDDSVPLRICPQCGSTYCKHWQGRDKPYDLPGQPYGTAKEGMRKGAPFAGYADFAACTKANSDKDDPDAYCGYIKHKVEDKKEAAMIRLSAGDLAAANAELRRLAASNLPQIQETTDSHDNPDPQGDQLNPAVMFPLNPAFGGQGDDDQAKQAARRRRPGSGPSNSALKLFGRMDAIEGIPPGHKNDYVFGPKAHGQYLRGHNETRGSVDAILGKDPVDKATYGQQTGRPDLHSHYLGVYAEVKARRLQGAVDKGTDADVEDADKFPDSLRAVPQGEGLKGYPAKQASAGEYSGRTLADVAREQQAMWREQQGSWEGERDRESGDKGSWESKQARRTAAAKCSACGHPEHEGRQCDHGYGADECTCTKAGRHVIHASQGSQAGTGQPDHAKPPRARPNPAMSINPIQHTADTLTRPHQSTDDINPPYNSAQTTPDPWSSNEGGGDFEAGRREGAEDARNGEKPTFSDNSSRVSPYVQGYAQGYFGTAPPAGQQDVPRSLGGDSGQAMNSGEAATAFQVSKAGARMTNDERMADVMDTWQRCGKCGNKEPSNQTSEQGIHCTGCGNTGHFTVGPKSQIRRGSLQHAAAGLCYGCPHLPHLGEPCGEEGCRHLHNPGEEGAGPGMHARQIGHVPDPEHPGYSKPPSGPQWPTGVPPRIPGHPRPRVSVVQRQAREYGKTGRLIADAFVTAEAAREPDFRKAYRFGARWTKGMLLVKRGSAAFEAGLYAAMADRPAAIQAAWVREHQRLAPHYPELGGRIDAHASFTRKFVLASRNGYLVSARNGCYPVTAATSVDLITDGPGTSPDPMGSTPLNGPGTPPPMGGQEDPAASGGPPPYQGAPPMGSGPVAPDDVLGQPQGPVSESGPFTQTFSGRHPGNADLAPAAPNAAGGSGYSNADAAQGDPQHKQQQALAFRRTVQASLAAMRARQPA